MLRITITVTENFDEEKQEFVEAEVLALELEHSLVSLSKWEQKWEIPFLASQDKTQEQTLDYIRMMNLGADFPIEKFRHFSSKNFDEINDYINAKMTATTFSEQQNRGNSEVITAELIYYWMIGSNIPFECQHWHLARLLTLIRVCSIKNAPKKPMTRSEAISRQRQLNAERRKQYGSRG